MTISGPSPMSLQTIKPAASTARTMPTSHMIVFLKATSTVRPNIVRPTTNSRQFFPPAHMCAVMDAITPVVSTETPPSACW
jgi:hypothetical protein